MEKEFESLLKKTKRPGIDDLIDWFNSDGCDFYYAPASTRYHGAYDGGLLEHSLNVYDCIKYEYDHLKRSNFSIPDIPEDSLIICSLLHDICKVNTYKPDFRNVKDKETGQWHQEPCYIRDPKLPMGHSAKSIYIVQNFIQLNRDEAQAIFWHMGAYDTSAYNTNNELSSAYTNNFLAYLLNAADMLATYVCENPNYNTED